MIALDFGIDSRAVPMPFESIHHKPSHPVVFESPGGEADLSRPFVPALCGERIHGLVKLNDGFGRVSVPDVGSPNARERQAFRFHVAGHNVGCLPLGIVISVVGHNRYIEKVCGVVCRIGEVEEFVFPPRHTLRLWANRPWNTGFAIIALAIGIGANTGVFSVVNALLLRSLPFRDPSRLAALLPALHVFSPPHDSAKQFHTWRQQST